MHWSFLCFCGSFFWLTRPIIQSNYSVESICITVACNHHEIIKFVKYYLVCMPAPQLWIGKTICNIIVFIIAEQQRNGQQLPSYKLFLSFKSSCHIFRIVLWRSRTSPAVSASPASLFYQFRSVSIFTTSMADPAVLYQQSQNQQTHVFFAYVNAYFSPYGKLHQTSFLCWNIQILIHLENIFWYSCPKTQTFPQNQDNRLELDVYQIVVFT